MAESALANEGGGAATASLPAVGAPPAQVPVFQLVAIAGPDEGKAIAVRPGRIRIGSGEQVDLCLCDPTVSRVHAELTVDDAGQVLCRDLDSRNGTEVNGVWVLQARLGDSALIRLGRTTLRLQRGGDPPVAPASANHRFGQLIGKSLAMRTAFALLERAAAAEVNVLLEGETGTGKEAAAESLHRASPRGDGPFVVVDCGAIPPQLLESELFGHERGSFTGAVAARAGAFEAAAGGTVFLDEIGELGAELQPKLLRVLERRQIKRVGSNSYQPVDVRVIAATNRDLEAEVGAGRFRSDLFYRLAVVRIHIPALRQRPEDIPMLVEHLAARIDAGAPGDLVRNPAFLTELMRHSWPGNVRELRNCLERCIALRDDHPVFHAPAAARDDAEPLDTGLPLPVARERWTRIMERRYVTELLERHQQNVTAAARAAGVGRIYLYRLLWRYGLR